MEKMASVYMLKWKHAGAEPSFIRSILKEDYTH